MRQPSYLTTWVVRIGDSQTCDVETLAAKLRQVPGVAETVAIAGENTAYLKIDANAFDEEMAEALARAG